MEIPKMKEYKVQFAIGFVVEALDEDDAEQKAIDMMYEEVSENCSKKFNIDIDEV